MSLLDRIKLGSEGTPILTCVKSQSFVLLLLKGEGKGFTIEKCQIEQLKKKPTTLALMVAYQIPVGFESGPYSAKDAKKVKYCCYVPNVTLLVRVGGMLLSVKC